MADDAKQTQPKAPRNPDDPGRPPPTFALTVPGALVHVGRSLPKAIWGQAPWSGAVLSVPIWFGLSFEAVAGAPVAGRSAPLSLVGKGPTPVPRE